MKFITALFGSIRSSIDIILWSVTTLKWMFFFPIMLVGLYVVYFSFIEFNFYNEYLDYTWHDDVALFGNILINSDVDSLDSFKQFALQVLSSIILLVSTLVFIYRVISSPLAMDLIRAFLVEPLSLISNKLFTSIKGENRYIGIIILIFLLGFATFVINTVIKNNQRIIPQLVLNPKDKISPLQQLIKDIESVSSTKPAITMSEPKPRQLSHPSLN